MIHSILILLFLIQSVAVAARPAFIEKTEGIKTTRTFDLNKDGKPDYTEVHINKVLAEKLEDLDFDGIFDQKTSFLNDEEQEFFKIVEQRKFGSNPKRKISYWNDLKKKKTFTLTQIDKNDDGKWDVEYKTSSELNQHRDECNEPSGMQEVMSLGQTVEAVTKLSDEYEITSWGHKVHKSCLDNGERSWFLDNSKKAIEQGLACLSRLGSAGGAGAARNEASLTSLLAGKNVQIICNETTYNWGGGTIAHATTSSSRRDPESPLTHPGISVNPASISEYRLQGAAGENEFVKTIFHEQLHNLGYAHGHDIEYPYACETCCFPDSDNSQSQKDIACNICSGNYSGTTDLSYVRDISVYGREFYNSSHALTASISYLKENPASNVGISYLAFNLSGVFDPIGAHLAVKLKANNQLKGEELSVADMAIVYKEDPLLKTYEPSAKIIADAYYASYKTRNPQAALNLLKTKTAEIKAQLNLSDKTENSQFVRDSLKDGLKKLIYDVWLDDYAGNITDAKVKEQLNMQAYQLSEEFGL